MTLADVHISISSSVIAIYGAVLASITALVQIISFMRDRVRVAITVQKNMKIIGDPRYAGIRLVHLRATNVGRRPVTITNFGAIKLYPSETNLLAIDTRPPLPSEITEGKFVSCFMGQDDIDIGTIDFWAAWDSHGRVHKLREAPDSRHWKSAIQKLWADRKTKKANERSKEEAAQEDSANAEALR